MAKQGYLVYNDLFLQDPQVAACCVAIRGRWLVSWQVLEQVDG